MTDIILRSQWKAKPPTSAFYKPDTLYPSEELWLHHFATNSWNGALGMRQCQEFHQVKKNWKDIAYSFCVDDDGMTFEGRGFGIAGGHTAGHNTISHAIAGMNNFDINKPSARFINSVVDLAYFGYKQGFFPLGFTGGHRDVGSTACPGKYLYEKLPEIQRLILEEKKLDIPQYDYNVAVIYDYSANRFDQAVALMLGKQFKFAVLSTDHSASVGFGVKIGRAGTTALNYPEGELTLQGKTGVQTVELVLDKINGEAPSRTHPWT